MHIFLLETFSGPDFSAYECDEVIRLNGCTCRACCSYPRAKVQSAAWRRLARAKPATGTAYRLMRRVRCMPRRRTRASTIFTGRDFSQINIRPPTGSPFGTGAMIVPPPACVAIRTNFDGVAIGALSIVACEMPIQITYSLYASC